MKYGLFFLLFLFCIEAFSNTSIEKLQRRMLSHDTLVCVGLDPDVTKMPLEILDQPGSIESKIYAFLTTVIDLTSEHVCAYKAQKAFYDLYPQGHDLLKKVVQYSKEKNQEIPLFIDCKIGDIENTMEAYIHNLFDLIQADGIVVNPYMGSDVFTPFYKDPEKVAIVLVQTSNPSGKALQELVLANGKKFWEEILDLSLNEWGRNKNLIPVLSSNSIFDPMEVRRTIPSSIPILLAGIGAQGGDLKILKGLLNEDRSGVFVNSSRALLYPYSPEMGAWREKIVEATVEFKEKINKIRYE